MSEPAGGAVVLRSRTRPPPPSGLVRPRLVERLLTVTAPRLAALVAPAGCGKTTLLAHAAAVRAPVGWLTLDAALRDPDALLAHLRVACDPLVPPGTPTWGSVEDALVALHAPGPPGLVVLDELHTLDGSDGGAILEQLARHQPARLRLLIGSRTAPASVLTRRLAGTATQLGPDDLRFRTWEVDELFRTHHSTRLRPREVDELTRRTSGWAAGLELFHLATRGRPASSRGRLLQGAGAAGQMSGDYLARHVLAQVPERTRTFLVASSVLGDLTPATCDELLGTDDAGTQLDTAHQLGLLTTVPDGAGARYRCHDVLRTHLLDVLRARESRPRARDLHRHAAELSLREGDPTEALLAYCRAEDWDAAQHLLVAAGGTLAGRPGPWIDLLPHTIRSTDPWVGLALARRLVVDGALDLAVDAYRAAADRAQTPGGRASVEHELHVVQSWLEPQPGTVHDWISVTRTAFLAPRDVLRRTNPVDVDGALAVALAELVAGDAATSTHRFAEIADSAHATPVVEAVALLGRAVGLSLAQHPHAGEARECARTAAQLLDAPALERLADGLDLACGPPSTTPALTHLAERAAALGDRWGAALLDLFGLCARLPRREVTAGEADRVGAALRDLDAPALTEWALAIGAVAAAQHAPPGTTRPSLRPPTTAATIPHALTRIATGEHPLGPVRTGRPGHGTGADAWLHAVDRTLCAPSGHAPATTEPPATPTPGARHAHRPVPTRAPAHRAASNTPTVPVSVVTPGSPGAGHDSPDAFGPAAGRLVVHCLGTFFLERDGTPVPVRHLRPQHQELLRALCVHAGTSVPRDTLVEWFWPGRDDERAQHSLQVAVSELRRLLEPAPGRGRTSVLRRDATGYGLHLEPEDAHDVRTLEHALREARLALATGDVAMACARYEDAVDAYTADLLPADGTSEWVAPSRHRLRASVVDACQALADLHAHAGRHDDAARTCRRGLGLDSYQDGLWQRLTRSLDADGKPAAAATARREYAVVLRDLDVPVDPQPAASPDRNGPARPPLAAPVAGRRGEPPTRGARPLPALAAHVAGRTRA
jgi:DNA-binding SARP family transcriptional activator